MVVEVVEHIATTPRGKRKFIDQRLDLARALANLQGSRAPAPNSEVAQAL